MDDFKYSQILGNVLVRNTSQSPNLNLIKNLWKDFKNCCSKTISIQVDRVQAYLPRIIDKTKKKIGTKCAINRDREEKGREYRPCSQCDR